MKTIKHAALIVVLPLALVSCASHKEVSQVKKPNELSISPSILGNSKNDGIEEKNNRADENKGKEALSISSVPDLGGIEVLKEQARTAPNFDGEDVLFIADELPVKEFTHKAFNEILGINYVLDATLAAKSPAVTLNISKPIPRKEFYETVIQTLGQLDVTSYRKNDILYLEQAQGQDKKNNIAIGIGNKATDVPQIAGKITQIVPYLYSESRNIASVMTKLSSAQVTVNSK